MMDKFHKKYKRTIRIGMEIRTPSITIGQNRSKTPEIRRADKRVHRTVTTKCDISARCSTPRRDNTDDAAHPKPAASLPHPAPAAPLRGAPAYPYSIPDESGRCGNNQRTRGES